MSQSRRSPTANSEKENSYAPTPSGNKTTTRRTSLNISNNTTESQPRAPGSAARETMSSRRASKQAEVREESEDGSDRGGDAMDVDQSSPKATTSARAATNGKATNGKKVMRKSTASAPASRPRPSSPELEAPTSDANNGTNGTRRSTAAAATAATNGQEDADMEEEAEDGIEDRPEDSVYDPRQPIDEKRKVRKEYRNLTSHLMAGRLNDPESMTASAIKSSIQRANELFTTVKTPAEAVLDSNLLMLTGDMAIQQARKMRIGVDHFDTDDFVAKLKKVITGGIQLDVRRPRNAGSQRGRGSQRREDDDEDDDDVEIPLHTAVKGWDIIGKLATRFTLRVPPIDFMLGPLAIPQKKKVQKKARQAKEAAVEVVRPEQITADDIDGTDEGTTGWVRHVRDVLMEQGDEGINLFKFLINPHSFNQTVENTFFLSFLIKEKRAAIEIRSDSDPVIFYCEPPSEEEKQDESFKPRQVVIELDMQMWEDAKAAYDVTESVIPHRKEKRPTEAARWYT